MITYCPHCGHPLGQWLKNGICRCDNCTRCIDNSNQNTLLSAAWMVRHAHIDDLKQMEHLGLSVVQKEFIKEFVIEGGNSHDELLQILQTIKIPELTKL